jgi:cytochrome c biogenesis protein ResB
MKLGVLYKNGKIVNHRSLLKVILNPLLRYFGYYIGSICENNDIIGIKMVKGRKDKMGFQLP